MKYAIKRLALGRFAELEISESEFSHLRVARDTLIKNVDIEQRYDILVENYLDVERTLLREATEYAVRPGSYENLNLRTMSAIIDRVITNFLASARAYVDHVPKGQSKQSSKELSVFFSEAYDSSLAYRTMEAFRNYVQHRGLPTHSLTLRGEWVGRCDEKSAYRAEKISPSFRLSRLRKDRQFKAAILQELLAEYGEECEIMPLIRKYQSSLSVINLKVRSHLQDQERVCRALLSDASARYAQAAQNSQMTAIAAVASENDEIVEEIHLAFGIEETLDFYRQRNHELVNLERLRFTS